MNAKQRRKRRRKSSRAEKLRRLSAAPINATLDKRGQLESAQKPEEPAQHSEAWLGVFNVLAGIAVPFEPKTKKED